MPRAEAGTLGDVIKKYARALLPGVQVEVSIRRNLDAEHSFFNFIDTLFNYFN
jgi:hypothetical protein